MTLDNHNPSASAPTRARAQDGSDQIPPASEFDTAAARPDEVPTFPQATPTQRPLPDDLRAPWGWVDVGLFIVFAIIASIAITWGLVLLSVALFGAKTAEFTGTSMDTPKSILLLLSQGLVDGSAILFLFAMLRTRTEAPFWRTIGWREFHMEGRTFQTSVLQFLGGGALLALAVSFVGGFLNSKDTLPIEEILRAPSSVILFGILGVLVAPLVEETIFRGFLYPVVARQWGIAAGVVVTGLLFGMLHAAQLWGGWGQIALLMFVGILLTWVRARTGSVTASYFVHLGYNGIQLLGYVAYTIGKMWR
jgi:membrane protease YdiL (CAAX protease family)